MKWILLMIFSLVQITSAHAGEFFEKDGLAVGGYDPVSFFKDVSPRKGIRSISVEYKGSTFLFVNESPKNEFLKAPDKFSPQFNGFCAFGVAGGYKAKTDPQAYSVVDEKLYLNYDLSVQKKWLQNREKFIEKANENWLTVKPSTKVYY